jgi:transcription elongation GreA/GreB family factor
VNPKKFLIELKRRNISESRDRKRARDADQHLTQNSNLHVVHQQGDPLRIAQLFERLRYAQSEDVFHIDAENAR